MLKIKLQLNKKNIAKIFFAVVILFFVLFPFTNSFAAINKQINYQGKLTSSSGVAVANGTYNMEFKLYDGSNNVLWTETRTGANKVQVTSGLFSVLLGEVATLANVDFNQTLYLGVNIGGTGTPGWDGEMTPRKKIGTAPSAIVAEGALNILGGSAGYVPFQTGANTTSFSSNFFWDNGNARLGVGTTAPGEKLAVLGNIQIPRGNALRFSGGSGDAYIQNIDSSGGMRFQTNNADVLTITNSGNVGIGTTAPAYKLDISGDSHLTGDLYFDNNKAMKFDANNFIGHGAASTELHIVSGANTWFNIDSNNNSSDTDAFIFAKNRQSTSGGTELMRIVESGNVGIGTTAPVAILDVNGGYVRSSGGVKVTGLTNLTQTSSGAGPEIFYYQGTGTFQTYDRTNSVLLPTSIAGSTLSFGTASVAMTILNNGNVGIGTTDPGSYKLNINGMTYFGDTAYYGGHGSLTWGATTLKLIGASGNAVSLGSNGVADRLFMDTSGNVGIGTTAPNAKLQIDGVRGNSNLTLNSTDAANNNYGSQLHFQTQGNARFAFGLNPNDDLYFDRYYNGFHPETMVIQRSTGNVGIGTTAPTQGRLQITDSVTLGGGVALSLEEPSANRRIEFVTPTSGGAAAQIRTAGTSNGLLIKSSGGGNQLFLKDDGNVGIGTTAPSGKLHILGSAGFPAVSGTAFTGAGRFGNSGGTGVLDVGNNGSSGAWLQSTNSADLSLNYPLLLNPNGGNVGIGTVSPGMLLDVRGSTAMMSIGNTTPKSDWRTANWQGIEVNGSAALFANAVGDSILSSNYYVRDVAGVATDTYMRTAGASNLYQTGGDINFRTAASGTAGNAITWTTPFKILGASSVTNTLVLNAGNVGIGTTNPNSKLDIAGNLELSGASRTIKMTTGTGYFETEDSLWINYDSNNDGANDGVVFGRDRTGESGGTTDMIITQGNVGIGNVAPARRMTVVGALNNADPQLRIGYNYGIDPGIVYYMDVDHKGTFNTVSNNENDYNFKQEGTSRLFIQHTSGNVGIGTTAPGQKLEIVGNVQLSSSTPIIYLNGTETNAKNIALYESAGSFKIDYYGNSNLLTLNPGAGTAYLAGNVGIGTTSPQYKLDVNGSISTNNTFWVTSGQSIGLQNAANNDSIYLKNSGASGASTLDIGTGTMVIQENGNIGIGTTNPTDKFHLFSSGNTRMTIESSDAAGYAQFQLKNATNAWKNQLNSGNFSFQDVSTNYSVFNLAMGSPANSLVINSTGISTVGALTVSGTGNSTIAGNLGIGTTAPSQQIEGTGNMLLNGGSSNYYLGNTAYGLGISSGNIKLKGYANLTLSANEANDASSSLIFNVGNTEKMRIIPSGNVGIGTTAPTQKLNVSGNILVQDGGALITISRTGTNYGAILANNSSGNNFGLAEIASGKFAMGYWSAFSSVPTGALNSQFTLDTNNGYVGIGTTAPGEKLEISGAGTQRLQITETGSTVKTQLKTSTTAGYVGTITNHPFFFQSNNTNQVQIDGSGNMGIGYVTETLGGKLLVNGNVGIGTTAPGVQLSLYRNDSNEINSLDIEQAGTGDASLRFINTGQNAWTMGVDNSNSDKFIIGRSQSFASNSFFVIDTSGNVGIGTTSPSQLLHVQGNAGISSNLYFNNNSGWNVNLTSAGPYTVRDVGNTNIATPSILSSGNVGFHLTGMAPYNFENVTGDNPAPYGVSITGGSTTEHVGFFGMTNSSGANANLISYLGNDGGGQFQWRKWTWDGANNHLASPLMVLTSGGNLGIGTTTPGYPLTVVSNSGQNAISILRNDGTTEVGRIAALGPNFNFQAMGTYDFRFLDASQNAKVTIQQAGNVGIGTTAPTRKLQVHGLVAAGSPLIKVTSDISGVTDSDGVAFGIDSSNNGYLINYENAPMYFQTNAATQMTILGTGNVGIGTTAPGKLLEIASNSAPTIRINNTNYTSPTQIFDLSVVDSGGLYIIANSTKIANFNANGGIATGTYGTGAYTPPANGMIISGNVGIGTTAPGSLLHLSSTTARQIIESTGANDAYITLRTSSTNRFNIGVDDSDSQKLKISGAGGIGSADLITIQSDGNVGIGTTAPSEKLTIYNGSILINGGYALLGSYSGNVRNLIGIDGTQRKILIGQTSSYITSIGFSLNGATDAMYIQDGGNVGIGTTAPGALLSVNGNVDLGTGQSGATAASSRAASITNLYSPTTLTGSQTGTESVLRLIRGGTPAAKYNPSVDFLIGSHTAGLAANTKLDISLGNGNVNAPDTNVMSLLSTGTVGIGTTSPDGLFDIEKTTGGANYIYMYNNVANNNPSMAAGMFFGWNKSNTSGESIIGYSTQLGTAARLDFASWNGSTYSTEMTLKGGNVGIGITAPDSMLQVGNNVANVNLMHLYGANSGTGNGLVIDSSVSSSTNKLFDVGYYSAGHQSIFFINGSGNTIVNSGNVGIGLTNPSNKLQVSSGTVYIDNAGGSDTLSLVSTSAGTTSIRMAPSGSSTNAARISAILDGTDTALSFKTSALDRLYINAAGNVGIGTTAPASPLDVKGGITQRSTVNSMITNYSGWTGNAGGFHDIYYDGNVQIHLSAGSASGASYINNGNLGIGTTAPGTLLNISAADSNNAKLRLQGGTYGYNIWRNNGDGFLNFKGDQAGFTGYDFLSDDGTHLLTMIDNGNVGIGTTSPSGALQVKGSIYSTDSTSNQITELGVLSNASYIQANYLGAGPYPALTFRTGGSEQMRITSGGNVGIGTTAPNNKLEIVGGSAGSETKVLQIRSAGGTANTATALQFVNSTVTGAETAGGGKISVIRNATDGGEMTFSTTRSGNMTEAVRILSSGNVGIGTTAPLANLEVSSTGESQLKISFDNDSNYSGISNSGLLLMNNGTTQVGHLTYSEGSGGILSLGLGTSDDVIIKGGNVGIGTTSPATLLDVAGQSTFRNTMNFVGGGVDQGVVSWSTVPNRLIIRGASGNGLSFGSNGTNDYMYINTSGNVGIGTTAPGSRLNVVDSQGADIPVITLQNNGNANNMQAFRVLTPNLSAGQLVQGYNVGTAVGSYNVGYLGFYYVGSGSTSNYLTLGINNNDKILNITGSGNVGIGTTAPGYKLHVAGQGYFSSGVSMAMGQSVDWASGNARIQESSYNLSFLTWTGSALTEKMRITSAGNVGIGTTAPGALLHVAGSTWIAGTLYPDTIQTYTGDLPIRTGTTGNNILFETTAGNGLMTILGTGNVGIGTTSPATQFTVSGAGRTIGGTASAIMARIENSVAAANGVASGLEFANGYNANGTNYIKSISQADYSGYLTFGGYNGTTWVENMRIDSKTGNVGIGTTSPTQKLDINGNANFDGIVYMKDGGYIYEDSGSYQLRPASGNKLVVNTGDGSSKFAISNTGGVSIGNAYASIDAGAGNMTITGNIGIGTTAPQVPLQIGYETLSPLTRPTSIEINGVNQRIDQRMGNVSILTNSTYGADVGGSLGLGGAYSSSGSIAFALISGRKENATANNYAGYLQFATQISDGTMAEKMRITGTGNVGIGTTAPGELLALGNAGTLKGVLSLSGNTSGKIIIQPAAAAGTYTLTLPTTDGDASQVLTTDGSGVLSWASAGGSGANTALSNLASVAINTSLLPGANDTIDLGSDTLRFRDLYLGGETLHLGTSNTDEGYFSYTTSSNVLSMQSTGNIALQPTSGNVGIGTTVPVDKLQVNGNVSATAYTSPSATDLLLYPDVNVGTTGKGIKAYYHTTAAWNEAFSVNNVANGYSNFILMKDGGNVGIGTTAPAASLDISSAGAAKMLLTVSDAGSSQKKWGIRAVNNGTLQFQTEPDGMGTTRTWLQVARTGTVVDSVSFPEANNIGIGTTSPAYKLDILGTSDTYMSIGSTAANTADRGIYFANQAGARAALINVTPNTIGTNTLMNFFVGGNASTDIKLSINDDGNVGIGTTAPSQLLHVAGAIRVTGGFYDSSNAIGSNGNCLTSTGSGTAWGSCGAGAGANTALSNLASVAINTSLLPGANDTIDLGSDTLRWKDLYLGGETLHLGTSTTDEGYFSYTTSSDVFSMQSTGNVALQPTSGNVGIGTTAPGALLTIASNGSLKTPTLNIHNTSTSTNNTQIRFSAANPGNMWAIGPDAGTWNGSTDFQFFDYKGGTGTRMMIQSSTGNVGIGTTTPTYKLSVAGGDALINSVRVGQGPNPNATVANGNVVLGNTAGNSLAVGSYRNYLIGYGAGSSITTGGDNVVIGNAAGSASLLNSIVIGTNTGIADSSVIIGNLAGQSTSAANQILIGYEAGRLGVGATLTIGIGNGALKNNAGTFNTAIGHYALETNTTGYYNTALGYGAGGTRFGGYTNETSNTSVFIGYLSKALTIGSTNEIVIGANAVGVGSNSVVLGNDNITKTILKGNVGIGTTAPAYKLDINDTTAYGRGIQITQLSTSGVNFGILSQALGASTTNTGGYFTAQNATNNYGIQVAGPSAGATNWAIYSSATAQSYFAGNVGIGTTVPAYTLDVNGTINGQLQNLTKGFTVTTGQSVTAGDVVSYINGQIKKGLDTSPSISGYGTQSNFSGTGTITEVSVKLLDSTHFVVAFASNYGKAVIGTISGTTITYGSLYTFKTSSISYIDTAVLDSTHFVLSYYDNNNTYRYLIHGTISGTTISFGSEATYSDASPNYYSSISTIDATHFILTYNYSTALRARIGTINSGNISLSLASTASGQTTNSFISTTMLDYSRFITTFNNAGSGSSIIGTITGTSVTFGTRSDFYSAFSNYKPSSTKLDSSKVAISFSDSTNNYGYGVIASISGNVITFGTPVNFSTYVAYNTNITSLGQNRIAISYSNNSTYGTAIIGNVSENTITFGTPNIYRSGGTSIQSISALNSQNFIVSYIGTSDYGYSIIGTAPTSDYIGIARSAGSAGSNVPITIGGISASHTGLTAGSIYYSDTAGTLSTAPSSFRIGKAISTTEILLSSNNSNSNQYFGDMIFANNFLITEGWDYPNSIIFKNQIGRDILELNENGQLATNKIKAKYLEIGENKLFIGESGNIGIGTTSPTTILDIASLDLGDGTAGPTITLGINSNTTNPAAGSINFLNRLGTNGYMWQDAAGNMRINNSAPNNTNDTAGVIVGAQTSIRETKQDINEYTDYSNALKMIIEAPLHTFRYKNEVNGYGTDSPLAKIRLGYIADEVDPMFMAGNSIDQVSVNGLLIASVKELNIKIEDLGKKQLAIFENKTIADYASLFFSDVLYSVENGIAYMKNLAVETLKIGSKEKPSGITMYDEKTGDPYCFSISDGATKTLLGECGSTTTPTNNETQVASSGETYTPTSPDAPVITLDGDVLVSLDVGGSYSEAGALAKDDTDGNVAVIISGSVDTNTPGVYTITYTATNSKGVTTTTTRTVKVGEVSIATPSEISSPQTPNTEGSSNTEPSNTETTPNTETPAPNPSPAPSPDPTA